MRTSQLVTIFTSALILLTGTTAVAQSSVASPRRSASAAAAPAQVHFTAAGDFGSSVQTSALLNGIHAAGSDFTLALGDFSYGSTATEAQWCDFVKARVGATYPLELLTGNHESNGLDGNINAFASCLPNHLPGLVGTYGKQWYVDVPATNPVARFVMISPGLNFPDGAWSYDEGTPRYAWAASAIDGARKSGIPWVVAGLHIPCLSMTARQCGSGADLLNLLVSKKVDLVLSGHNHLYERTKQLSLSGSCPRITPGTTSQGCVADGDTSMAQGRGTVFATVGTGGVPLQSLNTSDSERPYFASWAGSGANPTWGFLDVTGDRQRLAVTFHRTGGGTFGESFTISRAAAEARFVAAGHAASGAARFKEVRVPAQARPGDTMLMLFTRSSAVSWSGPSTPGWTRVQSFVSGPLESTLWKKAVTASDVNAVVRLSASSYAKGALSLAVYSGVDPASVNVGATAHTRGSGTNAHRSPTVTTRPGDLAVSYWADKSGSTTSWTAPTGVATRDTFSDAGAGRFGSLLADSAAPASGGAYGGLTARTNAPSYEGASWTVALSPRP